MDRLLLRSLFTLPVHLKNKHYVLTFIFKKPTKIVEQALVYGLGYHYSLSRNSLSLLSLDCHFIRYFIDGRGTFRLWPQWGFIMIFDPDLRIQPLA